MITLVLALAFMALCAALFLAAPFFANLGAPAAGPAGETALRAELAEIGAALARGDIDTDGAAGARADAERRFLRAGPPEVAHAGAPGADLRAALVVAALVVVAAGGLYVKIGRPDLISPPRTPAPASAPAEAEAPAPAAPGAEAAAQAQLAQLTRQLEARLKASPGDAEGWRALGWAYFVVGRYADAGQAYTRAIALKPDDAAFRSAYGESLVGLGKGIVTPDAATAFSEALKRDKADVRARFYLGLAKAQAGDPNAAIKDWLALYHEAPPGSDAAGELQRRIQELAAEARIDVSAAFRPAGPSAADVAGAAQMSERERAAMIDAMVTTLDRRLRQDPSDLQGWVRLIHARIVQNKPDLAAAALARARAAFPADRGAQATLDQAAADAGLR